MMITRYTSFEFRFLVGLGALPTFMVLVWEIDRYTKTKKDDYFSSLWLKTKNEDVEVDYGDNGNI